MRRLPGETQRKDHEPWLNKWAYSTLFKLVAKSLQPLTLKAVQTIHRQLFKKANTLRKMGKNKTESSEHT